MSGPRDSKGSSIPSWQREKVSPNGLTEDGSDTINPLQKESPASCRTSLMEHASKFLQDDDVKDAPTERKRAFLASKGLSSQEIDRLLGVSQNKDESSDVRAEPQSKDPQPTAGKPPIMKDMKKPKDQASELPSLDSHEMPPIITYPEFLLHTRRPPPLITINGLLTSLYAVTGAAATVYGTNKYIVDPMVNSLTSARHSFFETAQSNLAMLSEKLERAVSIIPSITDSALQQKDELSTTSDAADLFLMSAATQTTPGLSRSASSVSFEASGPSSTLADQHLRLQTLHSHLIEFVNSSKSQMDSVQQVNSHVKDLQNYLDSLAYGNIIIPTGVHGEVSKDEISKVKAEIRSVKGALLSAKNFPSGVGPEARAKGLIR